MSPNNEIEDECPRVPFVRLRDYSAKPAHLTLFHKDRLYSALAESIKKCIS
jgi:hypothetical protein